MKNWKTSSRLGFVAMAFMLATAVTATASINDLTKAKVVRIKGSARFTAGTGAWQPLKVGDVLEAGTVIQTAADSRVDLVLGDPKATAASSKVGLPFGSAGPGGGGGAAAGSQVDQNFVRLMENTVLSVDKLGATDTGADIVTDTQLDLRSGRIFGTVKKLSAGSRYEVKIPNGVAGVRGTVFILSSLGDIMVWEGSMTEAVVDSDGNTIRRTINSNQKYDPRTDQITDLSSQEKQEMIVNTGASQKISKGSNLWGDTTPINPNDPYLSPTQGYNEP